MKKKKILEKTTDKDILKEIAGLVFSKKLILLERKDYRLQGTSFRLEFRPFNPSKVSLFQGWVISDIELVDALADSDMIKAKMLENAMENIIEKSLDDINTIHYLERSFWKRLKYLFTKKL